MTSSAGVGAIGAQGGPGSPLAFRADLYVRSYRKHPGRLVRQIQAALAEAQRARQAGDQFTADRYEEKAEALEAARHTLAACRHCGRHLEDPISVARGIGPDCWRRGHREQAPGGVGQRNPNFGGSADLGPDPTRLTSPPGDGS